MKISFYNIGCKVNFAEISSIQEQFESLGHEVVNFGNECDAVIINTCTVTQNADADCRKIIRRAHRTSPGAFIGVVGCYAQLKSDEISAIEGVSAVFSIKDKFNIPNLIENFRSNGVPHIYVRDLEDAPFHSACSVDNESHTRVVLKIQDGCDYVCTYCTIPMARGKSRSMDFAELERTLVELDNSNCYELILSGINLGEYATPTGQNFADVLKLIDRLGIKQRVRISSIEPNLVTDEIIDIVSNSSIICPHFHIPLQSGSGEVLRLMKRRYKTGTFSNLITKIREKIPHCCIGVDVIAGFPGETDELFEETYSLLSSLPVTYLHAFTYSERENTPAASYNGKVSSQQKKERTHRLRQLSSAKQAEFYASQVNTVSNVIQEIYDPATNMAEGWTDNYIRVQYQALSGLSEKPVKVRLLEYNGTKLTCIELAS